MGRKVVLCGITGLIGSSLAPQLARNYEEIWAPVRSPHPSSHDQIHTVECDFSKLKERPEIFSRAEALFYCLGTTRKKAGSSARFREIEWTLATQVFEAMKSFGIPKLVLVSAKGADENSLLPYFKVKGDIERLAKDHSFRCTLVARPSLLMGERAESRVMEGFSASLLEPAIKPLQRFLPTQAPIEDFRLAKALIEADKEYTKGFHVLENKELLSLGK